MFANLPVADMSRRCIVVAVVMFFGCKRSEGGDNDVRDLITIARQCKSVTIHFSGYGPPRRAEFDQTAEGIKILQAIKLERALRPLEPGADFGTESVVTVEFKDSDGATVLSLEFYGKATLVVHRDTKELQGTLKDDKTRRLLLKYYDAANDIDGPPKSSDGDMGR